MKQNAIANLVMAMYTDEPCRVCKQMITREDLPTIVYAGYGKFGRSAHSGCWDRLRTYCGTSAKAATFLDEIDAAGLLLMPAQYSYYNSKRRARRNRHAHPFVVLREGKNA